MEFEEEGGQAGNEGAEGVFEFDIPGLIFWILTALVFVVALAFNRFSLHLS